MSYNEATGILFDWKGTGKDSSDTTIDFNEDLHGILKRTGILENLINNVTGRQLFTKLSVLFFGHTCIGYI